MDLQASLCTYFPLVSACKIANTPLNLYINTHICTMFHDSVLVELQFLYPLFSISIICQFYLQLVAEYWSCVTSAMLGLMQHLTMLIL